MYSSGMQLFCFNGFAARGFIQLSISPLFSSAEWVRYPQKSSTTKKKVGALHRPSSLCVTHTIRIFSAKGHGRCEPMSGFPPWHSQVLLSLQLLRHLLEKIRRPQVKRYFIPNVTKIVAVKIHFGFSQPLLQAVSIVNTNRTIPVVYDFFVSGNEYRYSRPTLAYLAGASVL